MTFKQFVEQWCKEHPMLLHEPEVKNKRFFLTRDIAAIPDFTRSLPENQSPCVLFDMMYDCHYYADGSREVSYTLYFMSKAGKGTNLPGEEEEVMHAFSIQHRLIQDFRKYCEESNDKRRSSVPQVDTYFRTFPYGPLLNGWYATGVNIDCVEKIECIE